MKSFVRAIVTTILSILLLSWVLPGLSIANTLTLILAGVVLAILNMTVRPFLKIIFLPINLVTLGLFGWVINVIVLYLAMWLVPGFQIEPFTLFGFAFNEFWSVVVVSFLLSLIQTFLGGLL
jgi:putative membrane protein